MRIFLSSSYIRAHKRKIKGNPQLTKTIKEKVVIFQTNPTNPTLSLHKLKDKKQDVWSFSVAQNLRILFVYVPEGVLFINIGTHNEVY